MAAVGAGARVLMLPDGPGCRGAPVAEPATEYQYFTRLYAMLNKVLTTTKPQKSVVLALDGPAPLAKLLLQRCAAPPPLEPPGIQKGFQQVL